MHVHYRADGNEKFFDAPSDYGLPEAAAKVGNWVTPLFMPRWASRITLEITDVRVQRLQDISGKDVLAEGVDNGKSNPTMGERWENMQKMAFQELWGKINGTGSWNDNPWCWCISFKRLG